MKKQLFILLSLIALLVTAQVPQRFNKVIVTGDIVSPKFIKTGSTVDSVLLGNGSARSVNSIKTDTSSLSRRINLKQDTLPFPEVRTGDTFLNDLGTFSAPPSSGGGSASGTPVYFWPTSSPTSGYLELDYTPYSSVVENTYSIPVGTTLLSSHLIDLQIATTTIDVGNWYISSRSKVNNLSGSTKLHVDFFLYHLDGTTTVLFGGDSETLSTTDYKVYAGQLPEASFQCVTTDRLGVSIYAINSGGSTKTLTISLGNGIATFFSTPLRIRHSNSRDKNGEAAFQHVTTDQISTWNAKQNQINGTGFVKASGGSLTFDNNTYSTDIHSNISDLNSVSGVNTGDETKTTIQNKLGAASFTNSGYLTSTEWGEFKGKVTFPGFGTTHTTAAYGDHLHTGTYEVPLTFSTGLTRTGNTITNNITQYTDAMARNAQLTANSTTTGLLTSSDWNLFNSKQPAGSYAPASGSVNYIQNQNRSAQSANMWISGDIKSRTLKLLSGNSDPALVVGEAGGIGSTAQGTIQFGDINNYYKIQGGADYLGLILKSNNIDALKINTSGAATFASTVNATQLQSTIATGTAPLTVNSTTMVSNLMSERAQKLQVIPIGNGSVTQALESGIYRNENGNGGNFAYSGVLNIASDVAWQLTASPFSDGNRIIWRTGISGTFGSWKEIYHSGNLTNNLTTNYIPKWNGSSMVNSLISDDGIRTTILSTNPSISLNSSNSNTNSRNWSILSNRQEYGDLAITTSNNLYGNSISDGTERLVFRPNGTVSIPSTTPSTSPTTGALVVNGGIGVGGGIYSSNNIITDANVNGDVANFNEFVKSGGTSSQFLKANGSVDNTNYQPAITLTTTGTSGVATFSGGVLNVPNYNSSTQVINALRWISGAYYLTEKDYWITTGIAATSQNSTIALPTSPALGKTYYIKCENNTSGTVTLNGNGNFLRYTSLSATSTLRLATDFFVYMIVWDGSVWQVNRFKS